MKAAKEMIKITAGVTQGPNLSAGMKCMIFSKKIFGQLNPVFIFATMLQKTSVFLVLIMVIPRVKAQHCPGAISGSVFSAGMHQPLAFVLVQIPSEKIQVFTNDAGRFEICGLKSGTYRLILRQMGFDSLVIQAVTGGKKLLLHLEEKDRWLNAVDVKGQQRHFESEVVENSALHGSVLEQNRGLPLGELLQKIPGVGSIQTGPGIFKPVVQGMSGQRVAVVQNGVKLEGQQWGFEHAPETDPGLADEVVVVRGAQSVRYGSEAVGGIILLEPGEISAGKHPELRLNSAFMSNGRGFAQGIRIQNRQGKNGNLSWRLSLNGRRSGNFHTARYILDNTALQEISSALLLRHEQGERWKNEFTVSYFGSRPGIFSGAHISSPEGIRQAFRRPDSSYNYLFSYSIRRPRQEIAHFLGKGKSHYRWNEHQESSIILSYQHDVREEFDIVRRSVQCPECPQLYFELQNRQADFIHQIRSEGHELNLGLTGLYQSNVVERRILIPNFRLWQGAAWFSASLYRGAFAWESGFRIESRKQQIFRYEGERLDQPVHRYLYWMANAGFRWEMSHHWHARMNLQFSQRPPSVSELYSNGVHQGSASFEKGSESLEPESISGLNASVHHESEHFDVLLNLFGNRSANYIYLSPVKDSIVLSIRGPFPFFLYRQTSVQMLGGDIRAIWKAGRNWQLEAGAAMIRSRDLDADSWLIFQPADRCRLLLRWQNLPSEKQTWQFQAEAGPEMVARQHRAPETDFVPPPPGYMLWNGRISVSRLSGYPRMEFSLEGRNVLNEAYRDYLNRFRYFALDTGMNLTLRLSINL